MGNMTGTKVQTNPLEGRCFKQGFTSSSICLGLKRIYVCQGSRSEPWSTVVAPANFSGIVTGEVLRSWDCRLSHSLSEAPCGILISRWTWTPPWLSRPSRWQQCFKIYSAGFPDKSCLFQSAWAALWFQWSLFPGTKCFFHLSMYYPIFQSSDQVLFLLRSPAWPHHLLASPIDSNASMPWDPHGPAPWAACVRAVSLLPDLESGSEHGCSASVPSELYHPLSVCP